MTVMECLSIEVKKADHFAFIIALSFIFSNTYNISFGRNVGHMKNMESCLCFIHLKKSYQKWLKLT